MPVGVHIGDDQPFTNHYLQLEKGDTLYMFSDGFPDQFGGDNNRKLMMSGFMALLESIADQDIQKQPQLLEQQLQNWKKDNRQIDDILVVGVHFK